VTDEGRRHATNDGSAGLHAAARHDNRSPADPGRGILGMRERCQLLGGDLTAEAVPGGGFEVTARLPLLSAGPVR
jgi:signal transduction histidine kinase